LSVFVFNDKFNLSFAMRFARFGVGGFKGCFDVGIVVGGEVYNIDAGAGGISLTANDKHSNDKHSNNKHADNNLTNPPSNNPANQPSNNPTNQASNNPALRSASLSMVAVANVNETLPSLSFLSSSGFLAIVPSTSARLTFTFLCLE
jgi:hypothetical protein